MSLQTPRFQGKKNTPPLQLQTLKGRPDKTAIHRAPEFCLPLSVPGLVELGPAGSLEEAEETRSLAQRVWAEKRSFLGGKCDRKQE